MNHEETEHIRDRFLVAALTGVVCNPHRMSGITFREMANDAMNLANEVMKQRREYYEAQDKNDSSKA